MLLGERPWELGLKGNVWVGVGDQAEREGCTVSWRAGGSEGVTFEVGGKAGKQVRTGKLEGISGAGAEAVGEYVVGWLLRLRRVEEEEELPLPMGTRLKKFFQKIS